VEPGVYRIPHALPDGSMLVYLADQSGLRIMCRLYVPDDMPDVTEALEGLAMRLARPPRLRIVRG
jgi:hypothetical protein